MKFLCSLLAAGTIWASVLSVSAGPATGDRAPERLAMLHCCDCVEHLNGQTRCELYDCPGCPVWRQARTLG
jgi:hypothetical protein